MRSKQGIGVEDVVPGSPAELGGIVRGDRLCSVNGNQVRDLIDCMYHARDGDNEFVVQKEEGRTACRVYLEQGGIGRSGLSLRHPRVKTCKNKCIFCFVSQLPRRLRPSLYVKDEDYRLSFLYGNFVTLTNLSGADKARIVAQRLSPLYISVHSTEPAIRTIMLGNSEAGDILKEIRFLADNRIRMHTQIVLCPEYNDGIHLAKTISDLYRFYPYVSSVAVVPVGLTMHRKKQLRPVEREDALGALQTIQRFQTRFRRKHGEFIVYASDEMYIKAGMPFPPLASYEDLPQIENGVGMVPLFQHQGRKLKMPQFAPDKRFVTFTGTSFFPYLSRFVDRMRKAGADIEAVAVENALFGDSVTVAGLLSGRDVMRVLSETTGPGDILLIPDVMLKEGEEVFLDDVSRRDVEDLLGLRAEIIDSTPQGLVGAVGDLLSPSDAVQGRS